MRHQFRTFQLHELMAAALVWFPCTTCTNPSHSYFVQDYDIFGKIKKKNLRAEEHKNS